MTKTELHTALAAAGWMRVERNDGRVDHYLLNSMVATIPDCDEALCQVREGYRAQMPCDEAFAWAAQS